MKATDTGLSFWFVIVELAIITEVNSVDFNSRQMMKVTLFANNCLCGHVVDAILLGILWLVPCSRCELN